MNRTDECRANAEECQRMAGSAVRGDEKQMWLEMAESWRRVGEDAKPAGEDSNGAAGKR